MIVEGRVRPVGLLSLKVCFREEFRTLASVRKSPKNEPAVQGMSYGDLRFEAASGGGVLPASSVVKAGL